MAAKTRTPGDRLDKYRAKRSADQSPEPFGGGTPRTGIFVVQKHAARRLHYDLRLELDGVLLSWAVPQGPSLDPAEKRLAVHTEDHPIEYVDFEGIIPADNYGAGAMIVWDRGAFEWLEDPETGLERGKLLFSLHGYKLRGTWTLVRMKRERGDRSPEPAKEWLLIKKVDGFSRTEDPQGFAQESILSGMTIEELRDGPTRAEEVRAALEELGAARRAVNVKNVKPMLCDNKVEYTPFSDPEWVFELKYDGYRLLASRDGDSVRLQYRHGSDATRVFPDLERVIGALPFERFILDGEVVVLEDDGTPSFQRLQGRAQLKNPRQIQQAMYDEPVVYYAFDLIGFEDFDLRDLQLVERKRLLRMLLPSAGPVRYADHIEERGVELHALAEQKHLEGIIGKKADSRYVSGRSTKWKKLRVERTVDLVVVGFTRPKKGRKGFGALLVATWNTDEQGLEFAGRVGTGFSEKQLEEFGDELNDASAAECPCIGNPPEAADTVWVEPQIIIEARYNEFTDEGYLRQAAFLRVRDDKLIEECNRPQARRVEEEEAPPPEPEVEPDPGEDRVVKLTNLDKVFWPEDGYTKGDLIEYYREVTPFILPYLRDRPVVLTRYPDGIHGKNFFQKDAPPHTAGWVRLERMWSEHAQREIDYFVCDNPETLLLLAQLGTIPLHIWSSRVADIAHPDWCILDLDPKDAPFEHVVDIALAIRELCDEMELECFVKTSGATGLHVLLPLGNQLTYEQSRSLGELMAKVIVNQLPDIATTTRAVGKRGGRVYIDYLQNGHGRLLVGPLSVRPRPGATVSTPLRWSELNRKLDRWRFTIKTVPRRLHEIEDPLIRIFDVEPDLQRALAKLAERLDS